MIVSEPEIVTDPTSPVVTQIAPTVTGVVVPVVGWFNEAPFVSNTATPLGLLGIPLGVQSPATDQEVPLPFHVEFVACADCPIRSAPEATRPASALKKHRFRAGPAVRDMKGGAEQRVIFFINLSLAAEGTDNLGAHYIVI